MAIGDGWGFCIALWGSTSIVGVDRRNDKHAALKHKSLTFIEEYDINGSDLLI